MDWLTELWANWCLLGAHASTPEKWVAGKRFQILLTGQLGTINAGQSARLACVIAQFEQLFGVENAAFTVLSSNPEHTRTIVSERVAVVPTSGIFSNQLQALCRTHHLALILESQPIQYRYSVTLLQYTSLVSRLMRIYKKPCLLVGADIEVADNWLIQEARKKFKGSAVITRSKPALDQLARMELEGIHGIDPAWQYTPEANADDLSFLKAKGWDGVTPILTVTPMDPFGFPIQFSIWRGIVDRIRSTPKKGIHQWFYSEESESRRIRLMDSIHSISKALNFFVKTHNVFVVIMAMDEMDIPVAHMLQDSLTRQFPVCTITQESLAALATILQRSDLIVGSRYNARTLSLLGATPMVALSTDDQMKHQFQELNHPDLNYLEIQDEALSKKLIAVMNRVWQQRHDERQTLSHQLEALSQRQHNVDSWICRFIEKSYPEIPLNIPLAPPRLTLNILSKP